MEYHFVVMYDDDLKKWGVFSDTEHWFPDGSVYSQDNENEEGYGFFVPEYLSPESIRDASLFHSLIAKLDAKMLT